MLQTWLRIGSKDDDYMLVTGCRLGWGLGPRFSLRLVIICWLQAADLAEDWIQGWWLYAGYRLQTWLRIGICTRAKIVIH